jgi:hypothetical protein
MMLGDGLAPADGAIMPSKRRLRGVQMLTRHDRAAEDLGNVVALEHINVTIPDQRLATLFYVAGLGLTRDPYIMVSTNNMWINIGRSQFHLPTAKPQLLRGHVGIVVPDRAALLQRLARVREQLGDTAFAFEEHAAFVETVSPWGNIVRCYQPSPRFGSITLGVPYVEFDVLHGSADGIARFYREILGAPSEVADDSQGRCARVAVGIEQHLIFRETERPLAPYDGHHVQIYIADFSGPHRRLAERGLITEDDDRHQYRFKDIVDPENGKLLYTVEHEVRSMRHPLYMRPLVNRNPEQTNIHYAPGYDGWNWSMPEPE